MANRVTQATVRVLSDGSPSIRVTQATVRVLSDGSPSIRVTQATVRVLSDNVPDAPPAVGGRRRQVYVIA